MKDLLNTPISRRKLVSGFAKGTGTAVLGLGLLQQTVSAQDMAESELPSGLRSFDLGDINITVMQENMFNLPLAAFGGGEGEAEALLASKNLPTDGADASVNVILLKTGNELILLDTGTGNSTMSGLKAMGVNPDDVTRIINTHWHGDHVGGVSTDGTLNFPNAIVHFPEVDWNFLTTTDNERAQGPLAKLRPAEEAGQLELYNAGELLPGIEAIEAFGHTPGHHTIMLSSGDHSLMFAADTFNNPVISLAKTEWALGFDMDGPKAAETRRAILSRLADEGIPMIAYHFPFPGTGYITRDGEAFAFTPSTRV